MKGKSIKDLILGTLFIIFPTILITYPLLGYLADHYSLLFIDKTFLISVFAAGVISAYILHAVKIRFLLIFGLLLFLLSLAYDSISSFPFNEFDAYYIANRFKINTSIFVAGWFIGFATSRWRYFLIIFSIVLLGIHVVVISTLEVSRVDELIWLIAPPLLYVFYVLFTKEQLRSLQSQENVNYGMIAIRLIVFSALALLLFWLSTQLIRSQIEETQKEISSNGRGKDGDNTNDKNRNNNQNENNSNNNDAKYKFNLDDYTGLRSRLRQSEELLFCAYIDNFIADGVPNPQYITLYHLNQYNVVLEQFEVDPDSIIKDLYLPDPTAIPQYFIHKNDSVLVNDKMEKAIKPVKSTFYIDGLNPEVFVAPSTAYACQPISVEEEYKAQYNFAYNVYSEVSNLNSAYFVYNTRNPEIKEYQRSRYEILRKAKTYESVSQEFMDYYTEVPEGELFDSIMDLADSLTQNKKTSIDKILGIRDYFLSKDENGKALFTYTLTPGKPTDPNIPNASLLGEFLFNTHKGYCTYFATSTLFMLRSLGIPTRMAVGFMTIDRSHKTPGWYWFYGDQAHAWTQVYFPEYGWLDFDMTISNEGAAQAPQPDGTPPTPPTTETLVAKGVIQSIDTTTRQLIIEVDEFLINRKGIELMDTQSFEFDAKHAKVYAGEDEIPFKKIQTGDTTVVVSFDHKIGALRGRRKNESVESYLKLLPDQIIIKEVYVPKIETTTGEDQNGNKKEQINVAQLILDWTLYLLIFLIGCFLILLFVPIVYHQMLLSRINNANNLHHQAEAIYKHAHFILNQMGMGRSAMTPMNYAIEVIDPKFGTNLESFVNIYLKIKYSTEELSSEDLALIEGFYPAFNQTILQHFSNSERFFNFLKPNRWVHFLINLNLLK